MSIYRATIILCDECGEDFPAGNATYQESRDEAASEGWVHDQRGDTCPLHNGYVRDFGGRWNKVETKP